MRITAFNFYINISMHIQLVCLYFNQCCGYIGAMVGYSLVICQNVLQEQSCLHRAISTSEANDMPLLHFHDEIVNDLFQRFYICRCCCIPRRKCILRHCQYITDCNPQRVKLMFSLTGKFQSLFLQFIYGFRNIDCMI